MFWFGTVGNAFVLERGAGRNERSDFDVDNGRRVPTI
jgi:hypothetical protein